MVGRIVLPANLRPFFKMPFSPHWTILEHRSAGLIGQLGPIESAGGGGGRPMKEASIGQLEERSDYYQSCQLFLIGC